MQMIKVKPIVLSMTMIIVIVMILKWLTGLIKVFHFIILITIINLINQYELVSTYVLTLIL